MVVLSGGNALFSKAWAWNGLTSNPPSSGAVEIGISLRGTTDGALDALGS
jgi:hypothetical protein